MRKEKKKPTTPKGASHRLPYRSLERPTDRQPAGRGSREICTFLFAPCWPLPQQMMFARSVTASLLQESCPEAHRDNLAPSYCWEPSLFRIASVGTRGWGTGTVPTRFWPFSSPRPPSTAPRSTAGFGR
jgi:hypothetical protein